MKIIVLVSKGFEAASARYRSFAYDSYLRQAGWEVIHISAETLMEKLRLLAMAAAAHTVVVMRKTFYAAFLKLLRRRAARLVFDFDDAIFLRNDGTPSSSRMARFAEMTRCCDHIFAGNAYLAERARQFNPSVTILPTSVELELYSISVPKAEHGLDLVWVGSRSTGNYLHQAFPMLEAMVEKIPHLRLKIVADFTLESTRLPVLPITWSVHREIPELLSAHIGIAPMPNDPWTQGKCGLKVLQYMAAGLPVIASRSGVHKELVQHGISGFLADTPQEWTDALLRLAFNPDLRVQMGAAGRKHVSNQFTVRATFERMKRVLDAL